jgi:hypothetical protein
VTVEFCPPVAVTFPFRVAVFSSTLVAALMVTVKAVSITIALFAPSEFAAPGVGSVRTALFPYMASLIVPPLSASAVVDV